MTAKGTYRVGEFLWSAMRSRAGWSLTDLADRAHVNRGDLSRYERGRLACPAGVFERVMAAFASAGVVPEAGAPQETPIAPV